MPVRVLYCGDSEIEVVTVHKGFDYYTFTYAIDDSEWLRAALDADPEITCDYLHINDVHPKFPTEVERLREYDVVILSDVGFNNLALTPGFRPPHSVPMSANRVASIRRYVEEGGGLFMIGGWMSFSGIYGKASYGGTPIEEVLPVRCMRGVDDRQEVVEGFQFAVKADNHPIMHGLPWQEPFMLLGYNRVELADTASLLADFRGDPVIAVREVGRGRSMVFTSDVAPHWAGTFVHWPGYSEFWRRSIKWLAGRAQE